MRAAEEQLHSASAQIGVATANTLPTFTISADGGFMNTALAHLLAPQNIFWDLAGNATQTVFDAGTLLHQLEGAKDTYQAAAWTYRGTVIDAVQNVADSLRALQSDADALRAARDFERAAKTSFDLANQQIQNGNANVLLLLNAQQSYLQADHSSRAGASRAAVRHGGVVPGAGRRLVESRATAGGASPRRRHRASGYFAGETRRSVIAAAMYSIASWNRQIVVTLRRQRVFAVKQLALYRGAMAAFADNGARDLRDQFAPFDMGRRQESYEQRRYAFRTFNAGGKSFNKAAAANLDVEFK